METTTATVPPPARPTLRAGGGTPFISVLNHAQLTARMEQDLRAIAVAAFTAPPWNEPRARAAVAAARMIADGDEDGHLAVVAGVGDRLCGFAYAVNSRHLERMANRGTSASIPFELRELAIDPLYCGLGLGAELHDALIAARPRAPRYLVTHPHARPALALYRSRGWHSTALIQPPPGTDRPRILMHRSH